MADLRDVEEVAREFGWRNVGPLADLADWLREKLSARETRYPNHENPPGPSGLERLGSDMSAIEEEVSKL